MITPITLNKRIRRNHQPRNISINTKHPLIILKKIDLAIAKLEVLASLNNGRPTGDVLDEVISMLKNISLN
jgi:hypothetical protein